MEIGEGGAAGCRSEGILASYTPLGGAGVAVGVDWCVACDEA